MMWDFIQTQILGIGEVREDSYLFHLKEGYEKVAHMKTVGKVTDISAEIAIHIEG